LLAVPFLTWYSTEGILIPFPSQMSLIDLFERGLRPLLIIYLLGVAASIVFTAVEKKPVAIIGAFSAAFPIFTLVLQAVMSSLYGGYYFSAQTIGVFTALLGSVLLESSYFEYRKQAHGMPPGLKPDKTPVPEPGSPFSPRSPAP
jgi:hypothetical protein